MNANSIRNKSLEAILVEIVSLSVPGGSGTDVVQRMNRINGISRQFLRLVHSSRQRHHNRRPLYEVQK